MMTGGDGDHEGGEALERGGAIDDGDVFLYYCKYLESHRRALRAAGGMAGADRQRPD